MLKDKTCKNGHKFQKTSDCPTCPVCEAERKPESGFLSKIAAPARRALEREGIHSAEILASYSEKEILSLHGMGPTTLPILRTQLETANLTFKK